MARLACPCLNINVFVTGSDWRSDPVPTSKLFRDLCPVKGDVAYEVNLDVGGIVVVSESMLNSVHWVSDVQQFH